MSNRSGGQIGVLLYGSLQTAFGQLASESFPRGPLGRGHGASLNGVGTASEQAARKFFPGGHGRHRNRSPKLIVKHLLGPAKGLAYKMGQMEIMKLRQRSSIENWGVPTYSTIQANISRTARCLGETARSFSAGTPGTSKAKK